MKLPLALLLALVAAACGTVPPATDASPTPTPAPAPAPPETSTMQLGAFSISLSVKDLAASRAFYEKLGFSMTNGDPAQNWVVLRNGSIVIGLFQGMFEKNMLTFNPGWDQHAQPITPFTDVRELQRQLTTAGVEFTVRADEASTGPGYFMLVDPDGNPVLVDQHVN